ncbi:hypothetical protein GYA93_23490 [Gordonia desulfuricans]|uniref:DUF3159 domain-containing protein n=1 Tax=Gordonia desulfuricans TaxID=89051 RepID=A0A7K3LW83_9ACTN|nr:MULTISPECIES: hypothetical protein [Gordonia]KOY49724.1 hypothetical protein ISGA_08420 [Gordonia sp. NB41Y]NDK92494.1 hypothetical protein [Gordonia desulfuricans]WLP92813.1 hypothetical protein Q9K23_11600 [Gordonia sp. NB41Y]
MNAKDMIIGLAPWILFSLVASHLGPDAAGWAGLAAFAAAAGLLLVSVLQGRSIKILDAAGAVTFGIISAIGFTGGHAMDVWLTDYGRGATTVILGLVMLVSAYTVPFTEQYARETVDPRYWSSPIFRAKNKAISLLWAGTIFAMALSHLIAGVLAGADAVSGGHPGNVLLNWVIPIVLIVFAVKRTRRIADADTPPAPVPAGHAGPRP